MRPLDPLVADFIQFRYFVIGLIIFVTIFKPDTG